MKALKQTDRIKIKLQLAKHTDAFLEVFGASSHQYILHKPVAIKDVKAFEETYNISLPDSYKTFLTEVGNGGLEYKNTSVGNSGAGPYYGIFALGDTHQFLTAPVLKYLTKEPFFNQDTTQAIWEKISANMDIHITDEAYDKEFAKAYAGILTIGTGGCSDYQGIILNGKNKGSILYINEEIDYCPKFTEFTNFLDWYENWLDDIISGKSVLQKGFTTATEESCIQRFLADKEPYWKLVSLSYIRSFERLQPESITVLKESYTTEKDEKVRLYILNLLTKFDYQNTKAAIAQLAKKDALAFLRNLHLYKPEKTSDWETEIHKIQHATDADLRNYCKYITQVDVNQPITPKP